MESKKRGRNKKEKKLKPKRAMTPYFQFLKAARPKFTAENPKLKNAATN